MIEGESLDWSYSYSRQYAVCPRALFYQHKKQASETTTERGSKYPEATHNPGRLIGLAVHQAINTQVEKWAEGGTVSLTQAADSAEAYLDDRVPEPEQQANEEQPDIESLLQTVSNHIDRTFSTIWPQISTHRYICHELLESISVGPATAWVRPDLCTRNSSGEIVLTDWKTGTPSEFDDPMQLHVYALWASHRFEPNVDRIQTQYAYTSTGEIRTVSVDLTHIKRIQDRIEEEYETWNRDLNEDAFPTDSSTQKCNNCLYSDVCPDAIGEN